MMKIKSLIGMLILIGLFVIIYGFKTKNKKRSIKSRIIKLLHQFQAYRQNSEELISCLSMFNFIINKRNKILIVKVKFG